MTELNEAHFYNHSKNKDLLHKKKMIEMLNELLKKYDSDDLISYIMEQSELVEYKRLLSYLQEKASEKD